MTYDQAISYFGTQVKLAAALGIAQPTVSCWGGSVPMRYQYQLEVITAGELLADRDSAKQVEAA
jgi:DNA-binding transcriptional regulator YdaS (Cro superfamily)